MDSFALHAGAGAALAAVLGRPEVAPRVEARRVRAILGADGAGAPVLAQLLRRQRRTRRSRFI